MDRNTLLRTLLIFGVVLLVWKVIWPAVTGENKDKTQPLPAETYVNAPDFAADPAIEQPADPNAANSQLGALVPEELCHVKGNRFEADLSTRGAALVNLQLSESQYADVKMITSANPQSAIERWRPLRTLFRGQGADDQLKYDRFNWTLEKGENNCKFVYDEPSVVHIEKTVKAGERPFELAIATTVQNLSDAPKKHRFSIETFAFYKNADIKGHFGRVSPFISDLDCARGGDVIRKTKDDFKEGWVQQAGSDRFVAVSNYYFASVLIP